MKTGKLCAGDMVDVWRPTGEGRYHELQPAALKEQISKWEWKLKLEDGSFIYASGGALLGFQQRKNQKGKCDV